MSLTYARLTPILVKDSVTALNQIDNVLILSGPESINYQMANVSNISNSQMSFYITAPSRQHIVDRMITLSIPMRLTFTGPDPGLNIPLVELGSNDAPRFLPLHQVMTNMSLTINSMTFTIQPNLYMEALCRYVPKKQLQRVFSTTPHMQDQYLDYADYVQVPGGGSSLNALASYGESPYNNRGGFPFVNYIPAGTTTIGGVRTEVYDVLFSENLMISPLLADFQNNDKGLYDITNMTFTFLFGDLSRVWSHSSLGHTITSISATIADIPTTPPYNPGPNIGVMANPRLMLKFYTPNSLVEIPKVNIYNMYDIQPYTSQFASLLNGATKTITSQNQQLRGVPASIFVFARKTISKQTFLDTDSYLAIQGLNINFNNINGILAGAQPEQLYQIAVKNGCNMSWDTWTKMGSVLKLNFGEDIQLSPSLSPGVAGNFQLQIQALVYNQRPSFEEDQGFDVDFMIVAVYDNLVTIENGQLLNEGSWISQEDVLKAKNSEIPEITYDDANNFYGGDFKSGLKRFVRGAKKYADPAVRIGTELLAPRAAPIVNRALDLIEGRGVVGGEVLGGEVLGGRMRRGGRSRRY